MYQVYLLIALSVPIWSHKEVVTTVFLMKYTFVIRKIKVLCYLFKSHRYIGILQVRAEDLEVILELKFWKLLLIFLFFCNQGLKRFTNGLNRIELGHQVAKMISPEVCVGCSREKVPEVLRRVPQPHQLKVHQLHLTLVLREHHVVRPALSSCHLKIII